METGCRGGQGSPMAVATISRQAGRQAGRQAYGMSWLTGLVCLYKEEMLA
jgi:hypothetical protein